jgi:oligoribonuclease
MADSRDNLVWLDMEMTGLEPDVCVPLQVAMVITTPELVELDHLELTIWQPEEKLLRMEPVVREMHRANGLTELVRKSQVSMLDAERKMLAMLARWLKPGEGVLAGNSIHQDRRFIAAYFPVINGYLHYRMVDVSTLKELARRWYGQEVLFQKGQSQHTALSDVRESIRELEHYRRAILRPKA